MKNNCVNCWNCSGDFCTMQKDMSKSNYRLCGGWKAIPEKIPIGRIEEENRSMRELRLLAKVDVGTDFQRFLDRGGHYSLNRSK